MRMGDDDKPFACPQPGCGMRFVNADHLTVHKEKHEMSLMLTPGTRLGGSGNLFVDFSTDQTPTPTKFLRNCEEIGLFSELSSSKNPFEDAFKKAAQDNMAQNTPETQPEILVTIEGGTLNTPIPQADSSQPQPEYIPLPGPTSDSGSTLGSTSVSPMSHKQETETAIDLRMSSTTSPTSVTRTITIPGLRTVNIPAPPADSVRVTQDETLSPVDVEHTPPPESEDDISIISSSSMTSARAEEDLSSSGVSENYMMAAGVPHNTVAVSSAQEASRSTAVSPQVVTSPLATQGGFTVGAPVAAASIRPTTQYLMQVMLQLPGGQTVPMQIPAAIGPGGALSPQSAVQIIPQHMLAQQFQVKTEPLPSPQRAPTPPQPAPLPHPAPTMTVPVQSPGVVPAPTPAPTPPVATEVSTTTSVPSAASAITKQKLKAAITQNVQQSVLHNNMRVMTEAVERVIAAPAQRPQTLLKAPSSGSVLLQQQPSLMTTSASVVQTQAADTSTPYASKRSRKSSEEDPDERRRKFLERNRAAAARCRFKRKQWITNLERKADDINGISSKLQTEINQLRAEVAQLKALLLAHKDCPIFVQQRSSGQINLETVNVQKMEIGSEGEQVSVPTKVTTLSLAPGQSGQPAQATAPSPAQAPTSTQASAASQMVCPTIISVIDGDSHNNLLVKQS